MKGDLHQQMLAALLDHADTARFHYRLGVLTLRQRPEGVQIGTVSKLADRIWSEHRLCSLPTAIDHVADAMPRHCYGAWSQDLLGLAVVQQRGMPWSWSGAGSWRHRAVAALGADVQYRFGWRLDVPIPFAAVVEPAAAGRWWPNQWWWARTGAATARLLASVSAGGER